MDFHLRPDILVKKLKGRVLFQVLHSGRFSEDLKTTIKSGHSSLTIFGPLAHLYTYLRIRRGSRAKKPYDPSFSMIKADQTGIKLTKKNLDNDLCLESAIEEAMHEKSPLVMNSECPFEVLDGQSFRQIVEPKAKVDIVFGRAVSLDDTVTISMIKERHKLLYAFFYNQYSKALLSAVYTGRVVDQVFLQALADPTDRTLFKISLQGLGRAIERVSSMSKLPTVKLLVPFKNGVSKEFGRVAYNILNRNAPSAQISMLHQVGPNDQEFDPVASLEAD